MRDFKRLEVWKRAHELTLKIYQASTVFPADERFGITSQLRRATASIAANLAEGCGRETDGDFCRFVDIASGSACEVEYHLLLANDLKLIPTNLYAEFDASVNEVKKMLAGLSRRLRQPKANS